jgi:hypothetical protein
LVFLRRQKAELEERTRELATVQDGAAATIAEWIKEDWMMLMQRLEILIEQ